MEKILITRIGTRFESYSTTFGQDVVENTPSGRESFINEHYTSENVRSHAREIAQFINGTTKTLTLPTGENREGCISKYEFKVYTYDERVQEFKDEYEQDVKEAKSHGYNAEDEEERLRWVKRFFDDRIFFLNVMFEKI